ncbi:hypothetical protein [Pseudomonas sp. RIT-To-2]|uniref:hypothetical protein n=1 Tax=Pseudomonas sp. RIT-To-2 TaxID=3462541 RepID=UPI002413C78F
MSHSENTITTPVAQLPQLSAFSFGGLDSTLLCISDGQDLIEGLRLAHELAEGIRQLCGRLDDCINNGEIAYCAEVRALGFLADVVSTLNRSARQSLEDQRQGAQGGAK